MDLGLGGRAALVTGSSQGIGLAVAESLAREGAKVALLARNRAGLERVADELAQRHGTRTFPVVCDLADPGAIGPAVAAARAAIGPIEILVTNAGGPPSAPFDRLSDDNWRSTYDLTLMSVVRLCREVIPSMKERGWGRIVHLTSVSVKQPIPNLVLSNSLRAAVTGLSKSLSQECAGSGITVNSVAPGYTDTERLGELAAAAAQQRGVSESEVRQGWLASIPAGRLAEPGEIGDLVAFLASERAAYINGTVIAIDGGHSKGLL